MITTPEVHTSLLSLVPINKLFIVGEFGSGKHSNASMYVFTCIYSNGQLFILVFHKCVKLGYIE